MKNISDLIQSDEYCKLVENTKKKVHIEVDRNYPEHILDFDKSRMNAAAVTISELESLLFTDLDKIANYASIKLVKYSNVKMEQEYPENEQPDADDEDVIIKEMPFYYNFLLIYLIEYFILRNNPEQLEEYLKSIRIPNSKKYAKELRFIYNSI